MQLLVKQIRWEANDVVSLTLVDPDGAELPEWEPGAHLELHLPAGAIRHYSLCGNPDDRYQYQVAVLKEPAGRGGSRYIHEELRVGSHVDVRTVRNNFRFTPTPRIEFIAGGIGITPLLPMIREAQRQGLDWRLWYGGRCRTAMAFLAELSGIDATRLHVFPADHIAVVWVTSAAAAGPGDQVGTAGRYVEYTEWIPHPDGRRLAVFPTDYARYDAPTAEWPVAWDEVTRLEPDADHDHMRDQFRCHVDFARIAEPDKPSWNLELWRPDTGYLGTALAHCNP